MQAQFFHGMVETQKETFYDTIPNVQDAMNNWLMLNQDVETVSVNMCSIGEYRVVACLLYRGKGERWHRKYESCRECGTTSKPHWSKGMCRKCYENNRLGL